MKAEINNRLVVWADEMYLEYHRGCFTSIVNIKKLNREAEFYLIAAETLLTLLNINLKGRPAKSNESQPKFDADFYYNKAEWFEAWRKLMFNQFHDIIPGTSIQDVYLEAFREVEEVIAFAKKKIDLCVSLAETIHGKDGRAIVFNPSSFVRSETSHIIMSVFMLKIYPVIVQRNIYWRAWIIRDTRLKLRFVEKCYEIFNSHLKAGIRLKMGLFR